MGRLSSVKSHGPEKKEGNSKKNALETELSTQPIRKEAPVLPRINVRSCSTQQPMPGARGHSFVSLNYL